MSGVFSKDIWCLLFSHYFDYADVLKMERVARRLHDFMTAEQQLMLQLVSDNKAFYARTAITYLSVLTERHTSLMQFLDHSTRGVCSVCSKTIKWKKLSKHQRKCLPKSAALGEKRLDQCKQCGWMLPYVFWPPGSAPTHPPNGAGSYSCPFAKKQCDFCDVTVLKSVHHECPMSLFSCSFCQKLVPSCLVGMHRCKKMCCRKLKSGEPCYAPSRNGTGLCHRHTRAQCKATTKKGERCTRAVQTDKSFTCGQHAMKTFKVRFS